MKRQENDEHLGSVLRRYIQMHGMEEKLIELQVRTWWQEQMGPSVNRHTLGLKLQRKCLHIELDSPALRQELLYQKNALLNRLQSLFPEYEPKPILDLVLR